MPAKSHRRRLWVGAGLLAAVVVAVVLVWFEPQKLFIDDRVDEALPTAERTGETDDGERTERTDPAGPAATAEPAEPSELLRGEFVSRDHGTSGVARVVELADGRRIVRLEDLDTDNGPDLYLYLSTNPAGGDEGAFDDDVVDLGRLKGNLGNQNYELPEGVDLSRYASVVVWCDRFDSAFGAADLTMA